MFFTFWFLIHSDGGNGLIYKPMQEKTKDSCFCIFLHPLFYTQQFTKAFQYHSNGQSNQYFLKQLSLGNYCLLYFKIEWCI